MARKGFDMTLVLSILVGAFLLLDGIAGVTNANSWFGETARALGRAFGNNRSTVALIMSIVELVAGALLILSHFVSIGELGRFIGLAILIVWIAIIVLKFFVYGFSPDTLGWWVSILRDLIILAVIWMVGAERR